MEDCWARGEVMKEILRQVDIWLQSEKDNLSRDDPDGICAAYHRGAIAFLTLVGKLVQESISQQAESNQPNFGCTCPFRLKHVDGDYLVCPNCGNRALIRKA